MQCESFEEFPLSLHGYHIKWDYLTMPIRHLFPHTSKNTAHLPGGTKSNLG